MFRESLSEISSDFLGFAPSAKLADKHGRDAPTGHGSRGNQCEICETKRAHGSSLRPSVPLGSVGLCARHRNFRERLDAGKDVSPAAVHAFAVLLKYDAER